MLFLGPIMLFPNAQNIPNNAQEVHLAIANSQYIAHYAQVESTIGLTKTDNNVMRHS